VLFFPHEGKFRYQFFEGKPWRYGLLTAPSDFPIYREIDEIEAEKDSLRQHFEPYFRLDKNDENVKTEEWEQHKSHLSIPKEIINYLDESLAEAYGKGIAKATDLEAMLLDNRTKIKIIANGLVESYSINDLYTTKSAYDNIISKAPQTLDEHILAECHLDNFLTENLIFDSDTSALILDSMIMAVATTSGMVQAGERIVDKGEIIDHHTYSVLRSLKKIHETKLGGSGRQNIMQLGQFLLIFAIFLCVGLYLAILNPKIFYIHKDLIFILLCILCACLLSEICVKFKPEYIYLLPFAIVPIVIRTFFDSHTALFTHLIIALTCSLTALFPYEFLLLQVLTGIVVIFSLKELSERSNLLKCSLFVVLTYAVFYVSLVLFQEGDFSKINLENLIYFSINFVLLMFSYILIYIIEKSFGYISPISLIELSNMNKPLLKRLSETAPGTFQHSMNVATLASNAAAEIGANAQLVRTGAIYHDIGKMKNPAFFTENQRGGVNPHDKLTFEESAQIIISHVTDGIKLAEKYGLPKAIENFIPTHHGRGKTKFFYNSWINEHPGEPVPENAFTYPGPNPFTKETAILMMADSTEATSRSLKEYTDDNLKSVINKIIDSQIADGLLKNAPLTLRDIETIKDVFLETLQTMYHTRISYPDLKK
jgi:putative nucleotidyltransferase with HDIG domain